MVVEICIHLERTGMQTCLVRERTDAHIRLMGVGWKIRDIGKGVGNPHHLAQLALGQHTHIEFGFKVAHNDEEVGVSGALAIAIGGALNVGGPRLYCRDRVGHRTTGVVLTVDTDADP